MVDEDIFLSLANTTEAKLTRTQPLLKGCIAIFVINYELAIQNQRD